MRRLVWLLLSIMAVGAVTTRRMLIVPVSIRGISTTYPPVSTLQQVQSDVTRCSNNKTRLWIDLYPSMLNMMTCETDVIAAVTPGYHHYVFIVPGLVCDKWAGLGDVGCMKYGCRMWINSEYSQYPFVYLHEWGHNMGLGHAGTLTNVYGDDTDSMGSCCESRPLCYNAVHLEQLEWMTPVRTMNIPLKVAQKLSLRPSQYVKLQKASEWFYVQAQVRPFRVVVYTNTNTKTKFFNTTTKNIASLKGQGVYMPLKMSYKVEDVSVSLLFMV